MNQGRAGEGKESGLEQHRAAVFRCVKCGSCRTVCPTFFQKLDESFSPRGRMALVQAVLDGTLPLSDIFTDRLASCTTCLACETVCAGSVPVTAILQAAREQAVRESGTGLIKTIIGAVLKNDMLMRSTAWLAPLALHYQSASVPGGEGMFSKFKIRNSRRPGHRKGTVLFFPGCSINYYQPAIGDATIVLLDRIGYDAVVPDGLQCCGRPLLSLGDRRTAEERARRNVRAFSAPVDAVVTACASCSLTFKKEYPKLLAPGADMPPVLDIHEFLADRLPPDVLAPGRFSSVTWHDPCHLGRGQGLAGTARQLIAAVPDVKLVEMKYPDRCCGFGGVMRLTHRAVSDGIVDHKAKDIMATGASALVTGCPSCLMQIRDGLGRAGSEMEVLHTVQFLAKALAGAGPRRSSRRHA